MVEPIRKPLQAIRRGAGAYVAGRYVPPAEAAPVGISGSIQPISGASYQLMSPGREGRSISDFRTLYTTAELDVASEENKNGDVVVDGEGVRFLVIGKQDRRNLPTVSHFKYYLVREN